MASPTQRTMAYLREAGWTAKIVEKWNPFARQRQDLWGGDIIALDPAYTMKPGIWLIQTTTGAHHAARREKVKALPEFVHWRRNGGRFAVVSWSKTGPRGKRKTWQMRWEEL